MRVKKLFLPLLFLAAVVLCAGCGASREQAAPYDSPAPVPEAAAPVVEAGSGQTEGSATDKYVHFYINDTEISVQWEDNRSVDALIELASSAPLTVRMSMYGGFEQVGPIGQSIVRDDIQTDTSYGDIVLYSGNQIVIFYGSNSWAYTRLGHIPLSQKEMSQLLGNGDVTITLEKLEGTTEKTIYHLSL